MGREIKFRAWDKNEKKWIFEGTLEEIAYAYDGAKLYFADTEWIQYTGLKDKNGKEIFEGDILLHEMSKSHPGVKPFEVKFEIEEWCKLETIMALRN